MKKTAHNRCCHCDHEWWDFPGSKAEYYSYGCPKCRSVYWTWLNYGEKK